MERNQRRLVFCQPSELVLSLLCCCAGWAALVQQNLIQSEKKSIFHTSSEKNSNFQILSEKWKCDILIFVNSNCLDFTTKTFVPKANKQLSELCLWLLGDKLFLLWLVAGKVWTRRGGGWSVPGSEVKSFLFCFVCCCLEVCFFVCSVCLLLLQKWAWFSFLKFEQFLNTAI